LSGAETTDMHNHGTKKLTPENWLEPDLTSTGWTHYAPAASGHMEGAAWLRQFSRAELDAAVPEDVRALFEVARGALIYGYLFYPLYTLGIEQLTRVAEAAITHRCVALNAPARARVGNTGKNKTKRMDFELRIEWLAQQRALSAAERDAWHGIRKWRNTASHPRRQNPLPPTIAAQALHKVATQINALFSATAAGRP
jgi:hypothetical protein